ncbi:MAG: pilin [Pseudomonadota bacterium]
MSDQEKQQVVITKQRPGNVWGIIASIFAVLGIFTIGTIFVPIAALVALVGTIISVKNKNGTGIGISVLAWVLTIVGLITSPVLLAIIIGSASQLPDSSRDKPRPSRPTTTANVAGQVSEGLSLSAAARTAVAESFLNTGRAPADRRSAGMSPNATDTSGKYVQSVDIQSGTIIVTYGNDAAPSLQGKSLALQPYRTQDDALTWLCGNAAPNFNAGISPLAQTAPRAAASTTVPNSVLPRQCK